MNRSLRSLLASSSSRRTGRQTLPPIPPKAAALGGGKSSGCRCWVGNLQQQNWIKLKFTSIIYVNNSSAGISPCPCLLLSLCLCVIKVVLFSNKIRLKSKIFEVMSFFLSYFMFICMQPGFLLHVDDLAA